MTAAHASLGPSSAERWFECPGSPGLCALTPSDETNEHAELGTYAHDMAAGCLELGLDAEDRRGATDGVHLVDDDMIDAVQVYLDVVRKLVAEAREGVAHVVDYKHGAGLFVDIEMNKQLLIYSVGTLNSLSTFNEAGLKVEQRVIVSDEVWGTADAIVVGPGEIHTVVYHIVQPRHRLGGHRSAAISAVELRKWRDIDLADAVRRTKEPPIYNAGPHCRYCDGKVNCPALRFDALEGAKSVFDGDPADLVVRAELDAEAAAIAMKPAELAKALAAFPVVEMWMKAIRDQAYTRARNGGKVPGFKLVDITGHRKFTDPDLVECACDAYGVNPFVKPKLASPAAVVKLLPKAHKGKLDSLIVKPTTGVALVSIDDKRPAKNKADVFNAIIEGAAE